jgi:hypothetical protein
VTVWRAPSPDDPPPPDPGSPEQVAAAAVADGLERTTQIPVAWETCIAQGRTIVASLRPALTQELTTSLREMARRLPDGTVQSLYHLAGEAKVEGLPDAVNIPGIAGDFIAKIIRLVNDGTLDHDFAEKRREWWMDREPGDAGSQ